MDGVFLHVWLFFIPVVSVGAFLIVQLFLAVLSDTFNLESHRAARVAKEAADAADAAGGSDGAGGSEAEVEDADGDGIVELDMSNKPAAQRLCYALISNRAFQYCILGAILCNTALMCCEYYGQTDAYARKGARARARGRGAARAAGGARAWREGWPQRGGGMGDAAEGDGGGARARACARLARPPVGRAAAACLALRSRAPLSRRAPSRARPACLPCPGSAALLLCRPVPLSPSLTPRRSAPLSASPSLCPCLCLPLPLCLCAPGRLLARSLCSEERALSAINYTLSCIFAIELGLKFGGMGFRNTVRTRASASRSRRRALSPARARVRALTRARARARSLARSLAPSLGRARCPTVPQPVQPLRRARRRALGRRDRARHCGRVADQPCGAAHVPALPADPRF
jgi:hypothetical protein